MVLAPSILTLPAYEDTLASSFRLSVLVPVYNERNVVEASLRRLLALRHDLIHELEVIVIDDCSTDGSSEILERVAREDRRVKLLRHPKNLGKGGAVRTGIRQASGDIILIHDADLEYNPADIPSLLRPFAQEGADAVFGSRFLSASYRRALMYRHTLVNKCLTTLANILTDLTLTDLETCYKAVNATLLRSIPLRSHDFRIEVELAFKLAKRRARIFEAPIRYLPRTTREGKKIGAKDGVLALLAMLRFSLVDDVYQQDEYGSQILTRLERARRFNIWMGDVLRPYVGTRVLEIGAGIGNITSQFIPRDLYVASDINPSFLTYLRSYSFGKPYLRVLAVNAERPEDFAPLERQFDTVVMLNVLEHIADERAALRNVFSALAPGGRLLLLVPQHPALYGTLDVAVEHCRRYTSTSLRAALSEAGFQIDVLTDFNRTSVPAWWLNAKVLRRKMLSRIQLKLMDTLTPLFRRIDRIWPWSGLSLIAVARRV